MVNQPCYNVCKNPNLTNNNSVRKRQICENYKCLLLHQNSQNFTF